MLLNELLFLILLNFALGKQIFPQCTDIIYGLNGSIDFRHMLYNCSSNINLPMTVPSMYNNGTAGQFSPTIVRVQYQLLDLVSVDDLTNVIVLDVIFRLKWTDPRWNLPSEIYDGLNPHLVNDGLDITGYVRDSTNLDLWLPNILFWNTVDEELTVELVKMYPSTIGTTFYWARQLLLTISQTMSYSKYPLDSQVFLIQMQSYVDSSYFVVFEPLLTAGQGPVVYNSLCINGGNKCEPSFFRNNLWNYLDWNYTISYSLQPSSSNPARTFSLMTVSLFFSRQYLGFVYRLGVPILLFLLIVGFSFWAELEERVDIGLQILLITVALYIVVGSSIPFVGYLTRMDTFVVTIFIALSVLTGIHFLTLIAHRKQEIYPLSYFLKETVVMLCRTFWMPLLWHFIVVYLNNGQQFMLLYL